MEFFGGGGDGASDTFVEVFDRAHQGVDGVGVGARGVAGGEKEKSDKKRGGFHGR